MQDSAPLKVSRSSLWIGGVLLALTLLGGWYFTGFLTQTGERLERQRVLSLAATAAAALDPSQVKQLHGSPADIGTPAFEAVRKQLRRMHDVNRDFRFVYLMRPRTDKPDQMKFLVDAEPADSADYSAPGDDYDGPSAALFSVQRTGRPTFDPPSRDRWGYWVTSLAPIKDPKSGAVIAILGMDINANSWIANIERYRAFALIITGLEIALVLMFSVGLHLQKKSAARDALAQKRLEERLRELSATDGLTMVANRRTFDEALEREWHRAMRSGEPLSLIMADIDLFKPYNDLYGHVAGDHCLKQVATAIADCAKRSGDLVARYGGEEFAVILPRTDEAAAHEIAERIRQRVEALGIIHDGNPKSGRVTISLGISTRTPPQSADFISLMESADMALYRAKESGRNAVAT
jgi:diguanylate cyclase (GGDEF)-like protein